MTVNANDIKSLFSSIGIKSEEYKNIGKLEKINESIQRWPLINAVESNRKAAMPLSTVGSAAAVATVAAVAAVAAVPSQSLAQKASKSELALIFENLAGEKLPQKSISSMRSNFMAGMR